MFDFEFINDIKMNFSCASDAVIINVVEIKVFIGLSYISLEDLWPWVVEGVDNFRRTARHFNSTIYYVYKVWW